MIGRNPLSRLLAVTLAFSLPVSSALADTLIDNVEGIRIAQDGKVERFSAMLVDDDGRVSELYRRGAKLPKDADYRVDGKGRVLLPGFIDSHVHLADMGFAAIGLDLADTGSLEEALNRISDFARRNPNKPWIIGRGWNEVAWNLGRLPTAADLDSAVRDRPVWLMRADGHAGWANSAALARAGITAGTRAPDAGRIMLGARGDPSGILVGKARSLMDAKLPPPLPEERDLAVLKAQDLLLARGITAVSDMGTSLLDWQSIRRQADLGRMWMRIAGYADGIDDMVTIAGPGPTPWLYADRLKLVGLKLYLDGALGSRDAWLNSPYADTPGESGLQLIGGTRLRNLMSRAAMDDFQVAIHAIGDAANREALDAIEEMQGSYAGDRRWRIEHAHVAAPEDLPRFGALGVIASMQPHHQVSDSATVETRLSPDRLTGAYAWRSMLTGGARLAFGSDAPAEVPDVFEGLADAITRQDARGEPFGGWQPQETVSREDALAAYTAGGAFAMKAEGRFGTLARGEWADFVFVTVDPLLAPPHALRQGRVLETWIAGRKVWSANEMPEQARQAVEAR